MTSLVLLSASSLGSVSPLSGASGGRVDRLRNAIGWTVTVAWATSFVLDAVLKNYEPPVSLHALMMLVAGAAFSAPMFRRNNGERK